jgi:predicted unusual protein kinase regulating ubiquinone biosynthesis (AarF/ABC1/UbiB family)
MGDHDLITSSARRFLKLGGLAGRVGASVAGDQVLNLVRSGPAKQIRQTENLVRNATRIVETLGEMKGAAMKVGQMLSLHEGLLPPEVAAVLRALQREAPRVPAEVMEYEIRGALPDFDELFESLEFEAFAAASIGQVHRGRLRDGREVAVKIQYPLIDQIVAADLKNLKRLFQSLFALVFEIDFEPFWHELRDRLLEELDYMHEAANIRRMAELHDGVPEIVIPAVVDEATTRNVLTMEFVEGISPADACSDQVPTELRNRWGVLLFEFLLRGLLEHRFLHADPNLANFSFLEDGRVIVYDFGCIKRVPIELARGVAAVMVAATTVDREGIPEILRRMGIFKEGDVPLSREITDPYLEMLAPIVRQAPPYTFGEDSDLYRRVFELGLANWSKSTDVHFPEGMIFIDRAYAGHFGNLCKLGATGPWRDIVVEYTGRILGDTSADSATGEGARD